MEAAQGPGENSFPRGRGGLACTASPRCCRSGETSHSEGPVGPALCSCTHVPGLLPLPTPPVHPNLAPSFQRDSLELLPAGEGRQPGGADGLQLVCSRDSNPSPRAWEMVRLPGCKENEPFSGTAVTAVSAMCYLFSLARPAGRTQLGPTGWSRVLRLHSQHGPIKHSQLHEEAPQVITQSHGASSTGCGAGTQAAKGATASHYFRGSLPPPKHPCAPHLCRPQGANRCCE